MRTTSGHLTIERTDRAGEARFALTGQIDEVSSLDEMAENPPRRVVIDLGGLAFMNSLGVRRWARLIRLLDERGAKVAVRNCPEHVTFQFNMIPQTVDGVEVESFFAPYSCPGCGHETSMCIDAKLHLDQLRQYAPPGFDCPLCGAAMEFEEMPERYLAFLAKR